MVLASFGLGSCTDSQAQYWGESPYILEKIEFGINVAEFYSKGQDITLFSWEEYNDTKHHYVKKNRDCGTEDHPMTLIDYTAPSYNNADIMARFGKFEFPYLGMLATEKDQMVAVAVHIQFEGRKQTEAFLLALADKYGSECLIQKSSWGTHFIWQDKDKCVQLCVVKPNPEHEDLTIRYEEDENGKKHITDIGNQPHLWYECHLVIAENTYCEFIYNMKFRSGEWAYFVKPDDTRKCKITEGVLK